MTVSTAKVTLQIENAYEDGTEITTVVTAEIALPIPADGTDERIGWEQMYIQPHTGTGKEDGDAWYDVEITESTVPELIGLTFSFGY